MTVVSDPGVGHHVLVIEEVELRRAGRAHRTPPDRLTTWSPLRTTTPESIMSLPGPFPAGRRVASRKDGGTVFGGRTPYFRASQMRLKGVAVARRK
jgi:hypothetical protein